MDRVIDVSNDSDDRRKFGLAEDVLRTESWADPGLLQALNDRAARRWVREYLLLRLPVDAASSVATRLLEWPEDLSSGRRDRSTAAIVKALSDRDLYDNLALIARSNAAGELWDRISAGGEHAVVDAVERILQDGDADARETTLHLLVLDPYGPEYLGRDQQDRILAMTLDDPDPEIRGLAAEVIAADMPELLLQRSDAASFDESERVRMAYWRVALVHRPDDAIESAGLTALDPESPHWARRTALLALGENATTREAAPVLQALLTGDDEVLADDAAKLMWRHHRAPDIANAAAESQFESVRDRAQRLLHPEMGSPAAGGSRPGDPTKTMDIFEQIQSDEDDRNR